MKRIAAIAQRELEPKPQRPAIGPHVCMSKQPHRAGLDASIEKFQATQRTSHLL